MGNLGYKTWGRQVYSPTLRFWLASMILCHVVYRLHPPYLPNLPESSR